MITHPTTATGPRKVGDDIRARVRHDAPVEVTTEYYDHTDVEQMTAKGLEGHLLVLGCLYNVSGYYNPLRPKVRYRLLDESFILKEGQLCECKDCVTN